VAGRRGEWQGGGRAPRRRFYASVRVAEVGGEVSGLPAEAFPRYQLLLDDKPLLTPAGQAFALPSRALADAIAREWAHQGDVIEPERMPLTTLANSAIDGVRGNERAVCGDIAKYAACDLLCYRADHPEALVLRQREAWDGILAWAVEALGVELMVAEGLMPLAQPEAAIGAVAHALAPLDPFALAAVHVMTTLTGSALLALATLRGRLTVEAAWASAHVDEAFQIARWGEDAEERARQERRRGAMQAAGRMLELIAA
jgi:chaperone required for assembly of F1-ATPase